MDRLDAGRNERNVTLEIYFKPPGGIVFASRDGKEKRRKGRTWQRF